MILSITFAFLFWSRNKYSVGGRLLTAGTDSTGNGSVLAGYASLRTIELLTKEGFTPIEVIRIATYKGAVALDDQKDIGSIEPGKVDDLVVFDGNISDVIQDN